MESLRRDVVVHEYFTDDHHTGAKIRKFPARGKLAVPDRTARRASDPADEIFSGELADEVFHFERKQDDEEVGYRQG